MMNLLSSKRSFKLLRGCRKLIVVVITKLLPSGTYEPPTPSISNRRHLGLETCLSFHLRSQEAKSTFRSSGAQPNRKPYKPLPFDDTPCSVNEHAEQEDLVTEGSGASVSLTYGWKHFIHEEYDVTFLHEVLPSLRPGALPDVIVLSTGVHNCWHFGDSREWENMREFDAFLAELDRTEIPLPKIVWLDNVLFINGPPNSGWPDVCRRFNEYFRTKIKERVMGSNRREAFVSREHVTWDTPAELWGDEWRLHLAGDVYVAVGGLVLQAMNALGV